MSPQFCSGMRQLARMSSRSSSLSLPALTSLVGGIDEAFLVAVVGRSAQMLPGTRPPTSDEWTKHQAKHSEPVPVEQRA